MKILKEYAMSHLGLPYVWGGDDSINGYDCCLSGETLISTSDGYKYIKDCKYGDKVLSFKDGKLTEEEVIGVHENGVKDVYAIRTLGSTIKSTYNHRFLCVKKDKNSKPGWESRFSMTLDWKYACELSIGDIVLNLRNDKKTSGFEGYSKPEIRFFGAMLGDGSIHSDGDGFSLCFLGEKKTHLHDTYSELLVSGFGFNNKVCFNESSGLMFHCKKTTERLIEMGMGKKSSERELPGWIFKLSDEYLNEFLRGYFDADGYRYERDSGEKGVSISSSSEKLSRSLHSLLLSRRRKVSNITINKRNNPIYIKGKLVKKALPLYTFTINDNEPRLNPSAGLCRNPHDLFGVDEKFTFNKVLSIKKIGKENTYDLTIKNTHCYIANGFVVHNSGLIIELMKSVGLEPEYDMTANSLMYYYGQTGKECSPRLGAIAFYGKGGLATHTAFCLDGIRIIEAGGGGSRTKTREDSARHNAYVRIRPVDYRTDYLKCYLPPYHLVGLDM